MASSPTGIELTCKLFLFPLTIFTMIFKPYVEIDGQQQQVPWQTTTSLPVGAGSHQVTIYWKYLWFLPCNKATAQVQLAEGQRVSMLYKQAWLVFLPGKITVTAQPAAA